MTEPPDDAMEERLRAILRAEAASADPSPEALSSIQSRTQHGSGWFAGVLGSPWLRPSLAVGAAAVIAGSVLLGTPQVRDQILPQSLTEPAGQNEAPPEHDGGGSPENDEDGASGKTTPEPGGGADDPSGGAPPPEDEPAEPEGESEEGAAPYGATENCAPGTLPTQAPPPSDEPGTTESTPDSGSEAPPTECGPDDEPTTPTDEPSGEVPGDGSTGGSTPPPGGGGGDNGDGGAPTTGPGNDSSGNAGGDASTLKAD